MAHIIQTQVLEDGNRNTIIKVYLASDGVSGELTDQVIFDASAYKTGSTDNSLAVIQYNLNGFDALLEWNATIDVPIITLDKDLQEEVSFWWGGRYSGLINNGGAGRNGDILLTTSGFSASGSKGYIWLHVLQRNVPKIR
jgi:hypothetical protein